MKKSTGSKQWLSWAIIIFPLILVALMWWAEKPNASIGLTLDVTKFTRLSFLETSWLYLSVNVFTLGFPLLLSFDKKVAFYKSWKFLFPSIFLTMLVFIPWDVYFTATGVWGFNPDYYIAQGKMLNLPAGEWLFFITVPYACLFIYECCRYYFDTSVISTFVEKKISWFFALIFMLIGLANFGKMYIATTCFLATSLLLFHLLILKSEYRVRFYLAFAISLIPFLLVNGVLTGGFSEAPLVCYNDHENLSIRLRSIPLDDIGYSFLMLFMATSWHEYFRGKKKSEKFII